MNGLLLTLREESNIRLDTVFVTIICWTTGCILQAKPDRQVVGPSCKEISRTDGVEQVLELCPQAICLADGRRIVQMRLVRFGECEFLSGLSVSRFAGIASTMYESS